MNINEEIYQKIISKTVARKSCTVVLVLLARTVGNSDILCAYKFCMLRMYVCKNDK